MIVVLRFMLTNPKSAAGKERPKYEPLALAEFMSASVCVSILDPPWVKCRSSNRLDLMILSLTQFTWINPRGPCPHVSVKNGVKETVQVTDSKPGILQRQQHGDGFQTLRVLAFLKPILETRVHRPPPHSTRLTNRGSFQSC